MEYPVACECGHTLRVTAGSAGSRLACRCGRAVDVPALHQLRAAAGEAAVSPELMIESLLRDGNLPQEQTCISCARPTDGVRYAWVQCERAEAQKPGGWTLFGLFFLLRLLPFGRLLGSLAVLHEAEGEGERRARGRDVGYRLPVRVCVACARGVDSDGMRKLLGCVPLYAQLLAKYPMAQVTVVRT
jgi:hypothetical protein